MPKSLSLLNAAKQQETAVLQSYLCCGKSTAGWNKAGEDTSQQTSREGIDGEEPGWVVVLEASRRVKNRVGVCGTQSVPRVSYDRLTEVAGECASGRFDGAIM